MLQVHVPFSNVKHSVQYIGGWSISWSQCNSTRKAIQHPGSYSFPSLRRKHVPCMHLEASYRFGAWIAPTIESRTCHCWQIHTPSGLPGVSLNSWLSRLRRRGFSHLLQRLKNLCITELCDDQVSTECLTSTCSIAATIHWRFSMLRSSSHLARSVKYQNHWMPFTRTQQENWQQCRITSVIY